MSYRGNHAKTGKISAMKVCEGEADRAMKADSAEGRPAPGNLLVDLGGVPGRHGVESANITGPMQLQK